MYKGAMMASTTPNKPKVSLKLLIDPRNRKVLFAEASKEFIDFLFNLLRLPIGSVIRLLTKNGMVGCIAELYESIENLNDAYMLNPKQDKDTLLKPTTSLNSGYILPTNVAPKSLGSGPSNQYICPSRGGYNVTDVMDAKRMNTMRRSSSLYDKKKDTEVTGSCGEGGFVKGVVTYIVMDNLQVYPMSAISTITLLSKNNITDISSLQERIVDLGMEEGIQLLQASLQCKDVLTRVFLK